MGTLTYFPTERYGAVTRATEQPHAVERLVQWLRKAAPIRAKASMGCEETLELAPNMTPIRKAVKPNCPRLETLTKVLDDYCEMCGYARWIAQDSIRAGMLRIRHGETMGRAIESAKRRADFCAQHGPKGVA